MDRRTFIATAGALALAGRPVMACAATASPCATGALVFATPYPAAASGPADDAFRLATALARATGRTVHIETSRQACSSIECLGTTGAAFVFAAEHGNLAYAPALGALTAPTTAEAPGLGLDAESLSQWLASAEGEALLEACHAPFAIKAFFAGFEGVGAALWSKSPLEDLAGRRIAASGLAAETLKGAGAETVRRAPADIAVAIRDDEIDAALVPGFDFALALGLHHVARACTPAACLQDTALLTLAVARPLWDSFDGTTQREIRAVCRAPRRFIAARLADDAALRASAANVFGVTFHELNPRTTAALLRVREAVSADFSTRSPLARHVHGAAVAHALVSGKSDCGLRPPLNAV